VFLDNPVPAPNALPVLSFFTGGGFLDLGFETAGFNIAWSNEYNGRFADLHDYAYTKWRQAKNPQATHYHLSERVLQALEFGVPQDRERLFVVGIRKGIAQR
jgi:site-specific DNA-cytosine methylase